MKKILILFICTVLLFSLIACDNNPQQDQPNTDIPEINNQGNEDENKDEDLSEDDFSESPLLSSSPYLHRNLAVVENKIKVIMGFSGSQEEYQIYDDQVITIKCDRFIFLKDGSIVDRLKEIKQRLHEAGIKESFEPEDWDKHLKTEMTEEILNDYHKSIGIKDIREDYVKEKYYVFLANGEVRTLSTKFNTRSSANNTSNSENTNSDDNQKNIVLRPDGTLNCPQFPEAEEWTDIVDYRMASNFILALTSDGKLLSSGIEFEHENIVKFDIWDVCYWESNQGDLPVALTADGNLIFGELTSRDQVSPKILENWDKQIETAKAFTDVEDFTFYGPNDDLYIIVQKTDGSIWATQYIDVFSEYVNIPNGVNISSGEEEIEAELYCVTCEALIPQGMSECPTCTAEKESADINNESKKVTVNLLDGLAAMDDSLVFFNDSFTAIGRIDPKLYQSIDPTQVADLKCGRFVFLKDGTIIDLKKDVAYNRMLGDIQQNIYPEELDVSKYENVEITESFLNDLNKSVGIIDIRYEKLWKSSLVDRYNIYTSDGKVYRLDANYATDYRQIEQPILNMDGTLNCPQFPETEEWTDIVDFCMAQNFILALTSDGKLLSSGIEFEHENIVKFDILDVFSPYGDLPVALTADGKLIFGELTSRDQISQQSLEKFDRNIEVAKTFTDVKDFTSYGYTVIVQKTDGSVWATQNDSSFTENVNIPDEGNISYDDDEEIAAELYCGTCEALIPQGMSECPECSEP